jgi:hypothetical protein
MQLPRINRMWQSIQTISADLALKGAPIKAIALNLLQSEPNPYGKNSMQ